MCASSIQVAKSLSQVEDTEKHKTFFHNVNLDSRVIHNVTFFPVLCVNAQNLSPRPRNSTDFSWWILGTIFIVEGTRSQKISKFLIPSDNAENLSFSLLRSRSSIKH